MHLKNNVNHKNIIVIYNYLRNYASSKRLQDEQINIFDMLDLDYPETYKNVLSYYTDSSQWSPQKIFLDCYLKAKEITGESDFFRRCGRSAVKFNSIKNYNDISRAFAGPGEAYTLFPDLLEEWNDTKKASIIQAPLYNKKNKTTKVLVKYYIHPHIPYESDWVTGKHIQGILESIPTMWPERLYHPWAKLPMAKVTQAMVQYDPVALLNSAFFKDFNTDPKYHNGYLYITDPSTHKREVVAKEVYLTKSEIADNRDYVGKWNFFFDEEGEGKKGFLITRSLELGGENVLEEGTIFNAPHFIVDIEYKENPITRAIFKYRSHRNLNAVVKDELVKKVKDLRNEVKKNEEINEKLLYLQDNIEKEIQLKKADLEKTQKKIIEREKVLFQDQISGGFVHEIRNGLAGPQLAISSLSNYKGSGKSAKKTFFKIIDDLKKLNHLDDKDLEKIKALENVGRTTTLVLGEAEKAVEHIIALTRKIRYYTNANLVKNSQEKVSIHHVFNIIKKHQRRMLKKRNIVFNVSGPELYVKADKDIFISVFENIILNSIDAIAEKSKTAGEIKIVVELNDHVGIRIRDNGIGISENKLTRIFDLFYTEKTNGSGLGLSLAKRFIDKYGGQIYAESVLGSGTEMIVNFDRIILWGDDEQTTDPDCRRRRARAERSVSAVE